ncbi:MAG TPA: hypothetical protein VL984_13005 [Acidimicrobiales bacterium]|nr:hypothetical protein [Acidimicrobiales bacterium]
MPLQALVPTTTKDDSACRLVDVRLLTRVFSTAMTGPFKASPQTIGAVACDYVSRDHEETLLLDLYSNMTEKGFLAEAFFDDPLPSSWSHPIKRIGEETSAWLLSGEAIVAFRELDAVVVVMVATVGQGFNEQRLFPGAAAIATSASERLNAAG